MFGESESESPRVPSPWDNIISTPSPTLSPSPSPSLSPSPALIPKLVPEAEEGNIEYKLQLLHPSPARFARLVTQLKWRLLEGGGQAYYELGVADSGALIGLKREELEMSLETLEMMAGEIGASVIVVKEIEVPAVMAGLAGEETDRWNGKRRRWKQIGDEESTTEGDTTPTEDDDDESGYPGIFTMDPETDRDSLSVDLEIASVFKPRPMRRRMHTASHTTSNNKRDCSDRKVKKQHPTAPVDFQTKQALKRVNRDRRRDEKRKALLAYAGLESSGSREVSDLTTSLSSLHVSVQKSPVTASLPLPLLDDIPPLDSPIIEISTIPPSPTMSDEDDVLSASTMTVSTARPKAHDDGGPRLIVEALVVRKLSLEEAFLDFGGFSLV
jgi:hypothetical protein